MRLCQHFPPHLCLYRWEGGVESGQEVVMILKTTAADVASLRTHVIEAHPYDVPVFAVLDVNGPASHAPFINWLQGA